MRPELRVNADSTPTLRGRHGQGVLRFAPGECHDCASDAENPAGPRAISPEFELGNALGFVVTRTNFSGQVELVIDGEVVQQLHATNATDEQMTVVLWDVSSWRGKQATLQVSGDSDTQVYLDAVVMWP